MYFSYHIFQGRHGLLAWSHLTKNLKNREQYLETLKQKHDRLAHNVDLLGANLCLDLLEEKAKSSLGLSHEDELVIVLKED